MKQQTYIMLTADEGKMLTNGVTYGKYISLGNGDVPENWREVPEAEYEAYLAEEAEKEPQGAEPS